MGATLGNLAGILAIVTGATASLFAPRLYGGGAQYSPSLAGLLVALSVVAAAAFLSGCAMMVRDIRRQGGPRVEADRGETMMAPGREGLVGSDGEPTHVARTYAPREPFILGLPAAALLLAATGLVLELLELVDVLPSRVIPLAASLVLAFAAFMVVRSLQRRLAHARAASLFTK